MAFYRKKPVKIEAIEWDATKKSFDAIVAWGVKWMPGVMGSNSFFIRTLEGDMCVSKGDFVIKGVRGEFYPCKPEIFAETYEESFGCELCEDGARLECRFKHIGTGKIPCVHSCPDCGRENVN